MSSRITCTADDWIRQLALQPHPEGGYFSETYRSTEYVSAAHLPDRYTGPRAFATAIYFLLTGNDFSAFHRIQSDELWHFYTGDPLTVYVLDEHGQLNEIQLGPQPGAGQQFQAVVKAGCWFGSRVQNPSGYALVGCTVVPGFDFADFELAERTLLLRQFPQHTTVIRALTRGEG